MSLFNKKKKGVEKMMPDQIPELPKLPSSENFQLPKNELTIPPTNILPKNTPQNSKEPFALPTFPNSELGEKINQNTSKNQ